MKTIKEAALEYGAAMGSDPSKPINESYAGFEEGVKFAQRWIPIDEELPPALQKVLIKVINSHKKVSTIMAQYVPSKTILEEDFLDPEYNDGSLTDYDEENDTYYVIEGWWEDHYEADTNFMITDIVTHWRPIEVK